MTPLHQLSRCETFAAPQPDSRVFNPHSAVRSAMRLQEILTPGHSDLKPAIRFKVFPDFGHMDVEITIDDTNAYARPWTFTEHVRLLTDTELMEAICNENNRDLEQLPGGNLR